MRFTSFLCWYECLWRKQGGQRKEGWMWKEWTTRWKKRLRLQTRQPTLPVLLRWRLCIADLHSFMCSKTPAWWCFELEWSRHRVIIVLVKCKGGSLASRMWSACVHLLACKVAIRLFQKCSERAECYNDDKMCTFENTIFKFLKQLWCLAWILDQSVLLHVWIRRLFQWSSGFDAYYSDVNFLLVCVSFGRLDSFQAEVLKPFPYPRPSTSAASF